MNYLYSRSTQEPSHGAPPHCAGATQTKDKKTVRERSPLGSFVVKDVLPMNIWGVPHRSAGTSSHWAQQVGPLNDPAMQLLSAVVCSALPHSVHPKALVPAESKSVEILTTVEASMRAG